MLQKEQDLTAQDIVGCAREAYHFETGLLINFGADNLQFYRLFNPKKCKSLKVFTQIYGNKTHLLP